MTLDQAAVLEPELVGVHDIEAPPVVGGSDPGREQDRLAVGADGAGLDVDAAAAALAELPEGPRDGVDTSEIARDRGPAGDPVRHLGIGPLGDGCEVVPVEGIEHVEQGANERFHGCHLPEPPYGPGPGGTITSEVSVAAAHQMRGVVSQLIFGDAAEAARPAT